MEKKKILIVYTSMVMGGSTTSLLGLLNNMDYERYEVDLQLFLNSGPLLNELREQVNLLPEAQKYSGRGGRIIKAMKYVASGYFFRSLAQKIKGRSDNSVVMEFQSRYLSRAATKHYDYALSFLEGWSSRYLAYMVDAEKKYAWNHSTFTKTMDAKASKLPWLDKVDNIVFVTEACRLDFINAMPEKSEKAITIENIIDSSIIRKRSELISEQDSEYQTFASSSGCKIVTVCRITVKVKGLDRIVDCAHRLKEAGQDFVWCIVGDGAELPELKKTVQEKGLAEHIMLVGQRMNPYPFIKAADFMCMPSRYEGKPMVITESMILGTPPLVTEYYSARDQIKDGVEGIVIANEDGALFDAVYGFMQDGSRREKMREYLLDNEYGNKDYIGHIENVLFS